MLKWLKRCGGEYFFHDWKLEYYTPSNTGIYVCIRCLKMEMTPQGW